MSTWHEDYWGAGWAAREAKDQGDLFESRAIWEGAAAHEARKELG